MGAMPDFNDLMNFDPLLAAEELTGDSYKEDEGTLALGALFAQKHATAKREELALRDDSYYGSAYASYIELVESLGFERVFTESFSGAEEVTDHLEFYWREGILLRVESYAGLRVNSASLYFNGEFADSADPWSMRLNGHLNGAAYDEGRYVWVGSVDVREGLRHILAQLEAKGQALEVWLEQPFMWLLNYAESRGEYDFEAITARKLALFPAEVRTAIKA